MRYKAGELKAKVLEFLDYNPATAEEVRVYLGTDLNHMQIYLSGLVRRSEIQKIGKGEYFRKVAPPIYCLQKDFEFAEIKYQKRHRLLEQERIDRENEALKIIAEAGVISREEFYLATGKDNPRIRYLAQPLRSLHENGFVEMFSTNLFSQQKRTFLYISGHEKRVAEKILEMSGYKQKTPPEKTKIGPYLAELPLELRKECWNIVEVVRREKTKKKMRAYYRKPEVKKRTRDYRGDYLRKPEVKKRTRDYRGDYLRKPEVKERVRDYRRKRRQQIFSQNPSTEEVCAPAYRLTQAGTTIETPPQKNILQMLRERGALTPYEMAWQQLGKINRRHGKTVVREIERELETLLKYSLVEEIQWLPDWWDEI